MKEYGLDPYNPQSAFDIDLFISCSRKDSKFTRIIERALEKYSPPKDIAINKRGLAVFRDEEDLTGVEYNQSLIRHLKCSKKMLVICSPNARDSEFVNEEIRLFADIRGSENIIPVLLSGIPNNEASTPEHEKLKAFPTSLTIANPIPLAANFPNFNTTINKITKGPYEKSWNTVLADFSGVNRSIIEERERRRKLGQVFVGTVIVASIIVVLTIALIIAIEQRRDAIVAKTEIKEQLRKNYWSTALNLNESNDWLSLLHSAAKAGELSSNQKQEKNALYRINHHLSNFLIHMLSHDYEINCAEFSRNRKLMITKSFNGNIRLWDVAHGLSVGPPIMNDRKIEGAVLDEQEIRILRSEPKVNTQRNLYSSDHNMLKIRRGLVFESG